MTVKDLIEILSKLSPDKKVFVAASYDCGMGLEGGTEHISVEESEKFVEIISEDSEY